MSGGSFRGHRGFKQYQRFRRNGGASVRRLPPGGVECSKRNAHAAGGVLGLGGTTDAGRIAVGASQNGRLCPSPVARRRAALPHAALTGRFGGRRGGRQAQQGLSALVALAETISRSLDLQRVLDDALEKVLEIVAMESGEVFVLDHDTDRLLPRAACGASLPPLEEGMSFSIGRGSPVWWPRRASRW